MHPTGPQSALLWGVDAVLRQYLSEFGASPDVPAGTVGLTDVDGKPTGTGWSVFYGICGAGVQGTGRQANWLGRVYGCRVVLTLRTQGVPEDRVGNEVLAKARVGLYDRADALAELIHGRYAAVFAAANARLDLGDDAAQGFHEGLYFTGSDQAVKKGARWFGASEKSDRPLGYATTLNFTGAKFLGGVIQ